MSFVYLFTYLFLAVWSAVMQYSFCVFSLSVYFFPPLCRKHLFLYLMRNLSLWNYSEGSASPALFNSLQTILTLSIPCYFSQALLLISSKIGYSKLLTISEVVLTEYSLKQGRFLHSFSFSSTKTIFKTQPAQMVVPHSLQFSLNLLSVIRISVALGGLTQHHLLGWFVVEQAAVLPVL